jgi:hypothetical protein
MGMIDPKEDAKAWAATFKSGGLLMFIAWLVASYVALS